MYNESKEYGEKFKSKTRVAICFQALLLMISFEDLISVFYWVFNTTTEGVMKIYSVKKNCYHFLTFDQENYGFKILEHFLVHIIMLTPEY